MRNDGPFLYGSSMSKIDAGLHDQLEKLIDSMGYELVGGEIHPQGRSLVFRIYIDSPTGVDAEDCSKVSRQVSAMLDVEDVFQGRYSLEVSSPGIDRPLFVLDHYRKHVGCAIKVRLQVPVNQKRQYKGTLQRVDGDDIYLKEDGAEQETRLPFSYIEKANVIGSVRLSKRH